MYRLRGEDFQPITRDHSLLQEQIDSGLITKEQARHSQNKNLVTRALGVDPTVEAELHDHDVLPGDVYLLCSDGLNDMVEDDEIGMTLGMLSANLELCAEQLVQMANDNGGRDNVSVIVIKVKTEFAAERETWLTRFLSWFK
jgi:protein phosphatase